MKYIRQIRQNHILALTIGIVYIWFGVLKFFPEQSPAEVLAKSTIDVMTMGVIPENVSIILLAIWETIVGLMLILNIYRKKVLILAFVHMVFTFAPFFIFVQEAFTNTFSFTLLGQYIFKNIIIIAGIWTLYKLPQQKNVDLAN